jgi:aminoglycoside 3-N-acetyltransferase
VLLLGAPLWSVSLLHHAEALVDLPSKRKARYRMPFVENAGRTWKMIEGIDSTRGAFPYARLFGNREEAFSQLVAAALSAKCGRACEAGQARCHVFEAALLVNFAIEWLRHQFSVQ